MCTLNQRMYLKPFVLNIQDYNTKFQDELLLQLMPVSR